MVWSHVELEKGFMSAAQKKAVDRHRARQAGRGFCRVEVTVPEADRPVIRKLAGMLRADDANAGRLRLSLQALLDDERPLSFAQLLESAPLEGVELNRSHDLPRDIEV